MSRAASDFKVTNIRRAIYGAQLAGIDVARVEIAKDGSVAIIPRGSPEAAEASKPAIDEWDAPRRGKTSS